MMAKTFDTIEEDTVGAIVFAKYKLFLSKLHKEYDWDEALSKEDQSQGKELVKQLIAAGESSLSFPIRSQAVIMRP